MSLFDNILAGLSLVGNVESFLALFVGVAIGTIAGAIPGMSATMAVALQGNRMSFMPELSGTENPRPKQPSVVLA